jgi:hypothetical protein
MVKQLGMCMNCHFEILHIFEPVSFIGMRNIGRIWLTRYRWHLNQGEYVSLKTTDDRNFAAGQSAIFLVAFYLVRLGYFLALLKSIFIPRKEVPYLGFGADSSREVFHILPGKKAKFLDLIRTTLKSRSTSVKTLQRIAGKCVSLALAVPAAQLFTREINAAISKGLNTLKPTPLRGSLRDEIAHWLFLEEWDDPSIGERKDISL